MAKKRIAHKTALYVGSTKLANVRSIGVPSLSREEVNLNCLDTEVAINLPNPVLDVGDVNFQLYWDEADSDHQSLEALISDPDQPTDIAGCEDFKIVFPFSTPIEKEFKGWIKELGETNYEVGNEVVRDCVITVVDLTDNDVVDD